MDLVKKHILSIVCGVVALLAIVLAFWPLGSFKQEAQDQLEKRVRLHNELKTLRSKAYYVPVLNPATSEPEKLGGFPTQKVIDKAGQLTEELARQKNSVIAAAQQANRQGHELLVPEVLPEPRGSTELVFRDRYLFTIGDLPKRMRAGHPPTQAEVEAAKLNLWKNEYEPKILMRNNAPDPESKAAVEKAFELEVIGLADREKRKRAAEISLYLAPDGLQVWPGITAAASNLNAKTIWYAQLSLWLQQDVMAAVAALNGEKNVMEAPVKQWVKFEIDAAPYRLAAPAAGGRGGEPAAGPGTPVFNESWTGRVCNPLYDVVKFKFIADVRASDLPAFLQELGRGRFITPLNVDVVAVDTNSMAATPANMIYGADPVARVTVRCESLFLRSWTLPLMPNEVKQKDLGIAPAPAN